MLDGIMKTNLRNKLVASQEKSANKLSSLTYFRVLQNGQKYAFFNFLKIT